MMTVEQYFDIGASLNAGFVDIYHSGKHWRLGMVTQGGDFVRGFDADTFDTIVLEKEIMEVMNSNEPVVKLPPVGTGLPTDADTDAELDKLLGI